MAPLVDDAAAPDFADLVDAVRKLIAAILDMDRRLPQRQVAAARTRNGRAAFKLAYDATSSTLVKIYSSSTAMANACPVFHILNARVLASHRQIQSAVELRALCE